MVKCKKCNSKDDYEITYIIEYDYSGDCVTVVARAYCCECGEEFLVKERFDFADSENIVRGK